MLHVFELSGLGKAPFVYVAPTKEEVLAEDQTFWCAHCGTMIKNRHFIKDVLGKVSIVGIDCLKKTGDLGLIEGERVIKKEMKRESEEQARMFARDAENRRQREANNGFTNAEMISDLKSKIENILSVHVEEIKSNPVMANLDFMGFGMDMQHNAFLVKPYSASMIAAIKKIHCKKVSNARLNSKAYKEASVKAFSEVDLFVKIVSDKAREVEDLKDQVGQLVI